MLCPLCGKPGGIVMLTKVGPCLTCRPDIVPTQDGPCLDTLRAMSRAADHVRVGSTSTFPRSIKIPASALAITKVDGTIYIWDEPFTRCVVVVVRMIGKVERTFQHAPDKIHAWCKDADSMFTAYTKTGGSSNVSYYTTIDMILVHVLSCPTVFREIT